MKKSLIALFLCLMVTGCDSGSNSNPGAQPSPAPQGSQEKPGKSADVQSANNVQNSAIGQSVSDGKNQEPSKTTDNVNSDKTDGSINEIAVNNAISVSSTHALRLQDGVVYSWGSEGKWLNQTQNGTRLGSGPMQMMVTEESLTDGSIGVKLPVYRYVAAGPNYSARVKENGDLEFSGQKVIDISTKDNGNIVTIYPTVKVSLFKENEIEKNVASVALGPDYVAYVTTAGELYTWGVGKDGKLGQYNRSVKDWYYGPEASYTQSKKRPIPFFKGITVASVAVGVNHTAAVTEDARLFTWGNGLSGKLGHGDSEMKPTPTEVKFFNKSKEEQILVASVFLGPNASAAVTKSGALYMWGETFDNTGSNGNEPKQVIIPSPSNVKGATAVTSVAIGEKHVAVLMADGRVYTWGNNAKGQLGRSGHEWEPILAEKINEKGKVKSIAVGPESTVVVYESGEFAEFGVNPEGKVFN